MAEFSLQQLVEISANGAPRYYDLAGDRDALLPEMAKAEITTPRRTAAFLANVCQETDHLRTLEEYGNRAYFESFLGAQWQYHGRGYLQNSWRSAYERLSRVLGVDLVGHPDRLARDKELAARAATWFWNQHDLNYYADQQKFKSVCSIINRGEARPTGPINGWAERLAFYERAKDVLDVSTSSRTRSRLAPEGFVALPPQGQSHIYQQRHPTRYIWRPEVEGLVRRLYRRFGRERIHINTYHDHPEGWAWDTASFDVWGPKGRNDPISRNVGESVFGFIYDDPNPPWVEWVIWQRTIYTRTEEFVGRPWGENSFEWHEDHLHFSFSGSHRLIP